MKISMIDGTGNLLAEAEMDLTVAKRWFSRDPLAEKYPSMSPYNSFGDNPIYYVDPDGRVLNCYSVSDKSLLFSLDDGKEKETKTTAKKLYEVYKVQWFEPLADNYMPLLAVGVNIQSTKAVKHFTWDEIEEFASVDRSMPSYLQYGPGDWKRKEEGSDEYYLTEIDGMPYWSDAIGQIPFAYDLATDYLQQIGDVDSNIEKEKAIAKTMYEGQKRGEGTIFPSWDLDNTYDNYFILRTAKFIINAYEVKEVRTWHRALNSLTRKKNFPNSNLGNPVNVKDAKKFKVSKKYSATKG